jgi:hypothetical protein
MFLLFLLLFISFAVFAFCTWAMDSLKYRESQSPNWLLRFDANGIFYYFDLLKSKGGFWNIIPSAICDAWHFFKMILIGVVALWISTIAIHVLIDSGYIYTSKMALSWLFYIWCGISFVWIIFWWFAYDIFYKTGKALFSGNKKAG